MPRPLSSAARLKILAAAGEVLFELGVSGFTVDEVAQRSGVAKTTIYRHFASGAQLIVRGLDCMIEPFPTPNTGSLRGDLVAYCEITAQITCNPRLRVMMLELLAAAAQNPELAESKKALMNERMGPIRTMLQLAMARGEISSDLDVQVAAELVEAPFLAHIMMHTLEPPSDAHLHELIDFVVAGLSGMRAEKAPPIVD